jgi:hypothetical protein
MSIATLESMEEKLCSGVITYHAKSTRVIYDTQYVGPWLSPPKTFPYSGPYNDGDWLKVEVEVFQRGLPIGDFEFFQCIGKLETEKIERLICQQRFLTK